MPVMPVPPWIDLVSVVKVGENQCLYIHVSASVIQGITELNVLMVEVIHVYTYWIGCI